MRVCHLSDIHWRGIARHEEYTDSFERLFDLLKRRIQPDLIINTGDTFHTKTQGITPEIIDKLSWMFRELADIAPTISILGNHDGNLTNSDRQDIISPIHEAINHSNAFLFKKSGSVPLTSLKMAKNLPLQNEVYLHIYSPFDVDGWTSVAPVKGKINIALFHGSVLGSETDLNHKLQHTERDVSFFKGMDFVLLGDIHKCQFLAYRLDKFGKEKPWIGYPGSLIQQNFGEAETKGFLLWEIKGQKDWDARFIELENRAPFVTIPWAGSVQGTLKALEKSRNIVFPGTRFRVTSAQPIQQIESRQLFSELKEHKKASEVIFKYDLISNMESIEAEGKKISKVDLRSSPDALIKLYSEYIEAHKDTYLLSKNQLDSAATYIRQYLNQLNNDDTEQVTRNVTWSLKSMEFDNTFRFGENNSLNFDNMEGVIGVFGPNKVGKSSVVGTLMYGLFNTTDRGPMKSAHIINKNKKQCSAKVRISISGEEYLIERETVRNFPKRGLPKKEDQDKTATTLNLYKIDPNGNLIEMNSVTRDDTDKEIRKLIGNPADFLMTALSNQGGINKFIEEGATQRKAILSRFLDLDVFEKLHVYAKEDFSVLNDKTKKYTNFDWTSALKRSASEIVEIEKQADEIQGLISQNIKRRDELKLWIMQHDKENEGVSTKKLLEAKKTLEGLEKRFAKFVKECKVAEVELEKSQKTLESLLEKKGTYNLETLQEKLAKMEECKTKLLEVRQHLNQETLRFEEQKKSVRKLDVVPCGDSFPTCQFIKDSHQDKKKIVHQEKLLTELAMSLAQVEEEHKEYLKEQIREQIDQLHQLEKDEMRLSNEIATWQNKFVMTKRDLQETKSEMAQMESVVSELTTKLATAERKEIEKNKLLLEVVSEDTVTLERKHRDLLVKLGGRTEQLSQLTKERAECKLDLEKLKIFESVQNAFSKNGIPAMVLKTQLPAINLELAKILDNIVDFKVTLETDITSNVMDVYIEDAHSRRIIELASGMEKMISSLALRVALINLSSLSRPDIFIIDEGFGVLDEDSIIKCMEMLSILKAYFKTILVITHVSPVKEVADRIIEINNTGTESKVEA